MKRIFVTGNAGSGKSTLAGKIAGMLGLPCHGLDAVVWRTGWRKAPSEEISREIAELTRREFWVIEGVSEAVEAEADVVVFLDVPRRVSYWRAVKRNSRHWFASRPGLPPGCPEILIIPRLCRIIWNFPGRVRPGILERGNRRESPKRFFHVRTRKELERVLSILKEE